MKKLIAVLVTSAFAFGSTASFAADAMKRDEMTAQEKTELRQRADRLVAERAQRPESAVVRRNEARPQTPGHVTHKPAASKTKKAHTKKTRKHASRT